MGVEHQLGSGVARNEEVGRPKGTRKPWLHGVTVVSDRKVSRREASLDHQAASALAVALC